MNDYFTKPADLAPQTKARSVDINTLGQAVNSAFDKLPTEISLKRGTVNYAVDTGVAANAYLVALPYVPSGYVDGLEVVMRPTRTNTDACTVNVNDLGVKPIKRADGSDPQPNDIINGGTLTLRYSTAMGAFVLPPVVQSQVLAAASSATSAANSATASQQSATNSSNYAAASMGYRDTAMTYRDTALEHRDAAGNSATLASQWAGTVGALVAATDYSAKEYAAGAVAESARRWAIGTDLRSAGKGSAKDWASYTGGTVDGSGYSAKHWALQASAVANIPLLAGNAGKTLRVKADETGTEWANDSPAISLAFIQHNLI